MKKLLSILLLLLFTSQVQAAISLVANVGASSTDSNGFTTGAINTTGSTLLIAAVTWTFTDPTLSDSKTCTWTPLTDNNAAGVVHMKFYYATNVGGCVGTGHTFTIVGDSSFVSLMVLAFSGTHTTAPYDNELATAKWEAYGNSTLATGSFTPTENNTVVIAGWGNSGGESGCGTGTINSGFTKTDGFVDAGGFAVGGFAGYLIQTTATAVNPIGDYSCTNYAAANIVSFKAGVVASTRRPITPIMLQ